MGNPVGWTPGGMLRTAAQEARRKVVSVPIIAQRLGTSVRPVRCVLQQLRVKGGTPRPSARRPQSAGRG